MNPDVKSFVWFSAGVGLVSAGLASVALWLLVVPGVFLVAVSMLRRSD